MRHLTIAATLAALLAGTAAAQTWVSGVDGGAAGAKVETGRGVMELTCLRGNEYLRLDLAYVSAPGLPRGQDAEAGVLLLIQDRAGAVARFPVRMRYRNTEDTWTGLWPVGALEMDWFAKGTLIEATVDATGESLLIAGMDGTAKARAAMRRACGI